MTPEQKTGFFATILEGRSRFLIFGPYLTEAEAVKKLPGLRTMDLENFPEDCIKKMQFDYGEKKLIVANLSWSQKSKFGQAYGSSEQKNLI